MSHSAVIADDLSRVGPSGITPDHPGGAVVDFPGARHAEVEIYDPRALLATMGGRRLKDVAGEKTRHGAALLSVLRGRRTYWDDRSWTDAVETLRRSPLTIDEFLELEDGQPRK